MQLTGRDMQIVRAINHCGSQEVDVLQTNQQTSMVAFQIPNRGMGRYCLCPKLNKIGGV